MAEKSTNDVIKKMSDKSRKKISIIEGVWQVTLFWQCKRGSQNLPTLTFAHREAASKYHIWILKYDKLRALVHKSFSQRHNIDSGLRNIEWRDQNSIIMYIYGIQCDFINFNKWCLWLITITFITDLCNSKRNPCHTLKELSSKSLNGRLVA